MLDESKAGGRGLLSHLRVWSEVGVTDPDDDDDDEAVEMDEI